MRPRCHEHRGRGCAVACRFPDPAGAGHRCRIAGAAAGR
jgi:hypothetical protein